jgi:putative addiction module killer protein
MKYELQSTELFNKWLAKIKDREAHARILRRIDSMGIGSFGDCKTNKANLFELRLFFGPGVPGVLHHQKQKNSLPAGWRG